MAIKQSVEIFTIKKTKDWTKFTGYLDKHHAGRQAVFDFTELGVTLLAYLFRLHAFLRVCSKTVPVT